MITAAQLRAARGLLDWSRGDLAKAAKVSQETIKNIEHGVFRPQDATEEAIIRAFALHDVKFFEDDGVKRSSSLITSYEGTKDFRNYVDNFYNSLSFLEKTDVSVCAAGVDDRLFVAALGDYVSVHADRMSKLKGLHFRSIVNHRDAALFPAYVDYKIVPNMPMSVLFGVYGQYFDLTIYGKDEKVFPKVVVIKSSIVVDAYRSQFESMWDAGTSL